MTEGRSQMVFGAGCHCWTSEREKPVPAKAEYCAISPHDDGWKDSAVCSISARFSVQVDEADPVLTRFPRCM
jgi:hypothetical protein